MLWVLFVQSSWIQYRQPCFTLHLKTSITAQQIKDPNPTVWNQTNCQFYETCNILFSLQVYDLIVISGGGGGGGGVTDEICDDLELCVVFFCTQRFCFVDVFSEVLCRGWAWLPWMAGAPASHTSYSSSDHQRQHKCPGLLSTRCQIVSTCHGGICGNTASATFSDSFAIACATPELRHHQLKVPQIVHVSFTCAST